MKECFMQQGEFMIRILLAGICGAAIGYERKSRNKEAGIRTHVIVSMGAALIMIISKYGFADVIGSSGYSLDPSRIAAQIVSGVGFLGAGMIFMRKNTISGLTTAAGIWTTSAISMAIGCGLYLIGIATALLMIMIQVILHSRLIHEAYKEEISFLIHKDKAAVKDLEKQLKQQRIEVLNIQITTQKGSYLVDMTVNVPEGYHSSDLMKLFGACDYIEEINL